MNRKHLSITAVFLTIINVCPLFAQFDSKNIQSDVSIQPKDTALNPDNQKDNSLNTSTISDDKGVNLSKQGISLDLKGIDVAELFKVLSAKVGKNIVLSKGVSGPVNIFLNDLSFEDALDVILMTQNLACERSDKIINIMTSSEYEARYGKKYYEKREIKTVKLNYAKPSSLLAVLGQIKSDVGKIIIDESTGTVLLIDIPEKLKLMAETIKAVDQPLNTEIIDLNYAKSADIKAQVANAVTAGTGELFTDERSARVAISDLPGKTKKIRNLIEAFDTKPLQVFIEAEIVQVVLNNQFQRGIDWEKIFDENDLKDLALAGKFPVSPVLSTYQKITIGNLSRDNFTAAINLLKTYGNTRILSRPRVAAINNQEAKILVGAREAYVSQSLSQAQTTTVTTENVQFIDVGVKLMVVPTINKDGFVTIKIKPEVSSVRETLVTSLGSRIPIVETSEAETVVTVKDGTMVMIAGLIKDEKRDDNLGLPILSKIPFLGGLFGTRSTQDKQTELIVFITPHIISGDKDMEIEKYLPAEMVPDDIKDTIISKKIENIKVRRNKEEIFDEKELKNTARSQEKIIPVDIGSKMKGKKEF